MTTALLVLFLHFILEQKTEFLSGIPFRFTDLSLKFSKQ